MRLLADENIQPATVELLRSIGNDVQCIREEGLSSISDADVFSHARETGRTLITFNTDFADIRDLAGRHHPGIIRLRVSNQRTSYLHPVLERAFKKIGNMAMADMLVTICDRRLRIRHTYSF